MVPRPDAAYDPHPGLVALGACVEIEMIDHDGGVERLVFDIVPDRSADIDAGYLGAGTPLAGAIMGRPAGAVIPYRLADVTQVRILSVRTSVRRPEGSAADDRTAATQNAVRRSETEDIVRLALTFSSKWGDYDPTPLEHDRPNEEGPAGA